MTFKPDPSKEAQEKIFSRKCTNEDNPPIYFNNMLVIQTTNQKHIGLFLDEKCHFGAKGATSLSLFKAPLLKMVRPHPNFTCKIHNPVEMKLLMRLPIGLSHLNEPKLKYNFG